jgi:hypothetical protein
MINTYEYKLGPHPYQPLLDSMTSEEAVEFVDFVLPAVLSLSDEEFAQLECWVAAL